MALPLIVSILHRLQGLETLSHFVLVEGTLYVHTICNALTAAHIVSRRYAATRTDPRNGLPLCLNSHRFFTSAPLAWDAFVVKVIGRERFEELKAKAQGRAA